MKFLPLVMVELQKLRRSKIVLVLLATAVFLWLPGIVNAHIYLERTDLGIPPEQNFFIQGLLEMAWFIFPSGMVLCTVLLIQTERSGRGLMRMLSLPVSAVRLCMAKFIILLILAVFLALACAGVYFISAAIVSAAQQYDFSLPPLYVLTQTAVLLLAGLPMLTFFWLLAVCIQAPIFSIGIGLFSIVPAVLAANTKIWYLYPMCYPFYIVTAEYGRLAERINTWQVSLLPFLPAALLFSAACLTACCLCFGQTERR